MSELKLEVGEYYVDRIGNIAGPAKDQRLNSPYPFRVGGSSYTSGGHFYGHLRHSVLDLIEHLPRTDSRHPEHNLAELKDHLESESIRGDLWEWTVKETNPLSDLVTVVYVSAMPDDTLHLNQ